MQICRTCQRRFRVGVEHCSADGSALDDELLGQVLLDQFEIQALLGRGATGSVYRAWQRTMERLVAIKILHEELAGDPDFVRRFRREARAVAKLSHPAIVGIYLVAETQKGVPYLAMEHCDGVTLADVCESEAPLAPARALNLVRQIADGVAEAHSHGVIHRDLKPANIILPTRDDGVETVKILDFGIAKVSDGELRDSHATQMGSLIGTPHYMSPEQASGQSVDGRSDLYSLGMILFELLTGDVLFDGENGMQVLLKQINEPLPDLRREYPNIPEEVVEILECVLQKRPDQRYSNAVEFSEAIADAEAQLSGVSHSATRRRSRRLESPLRIGNGLERDRRSDENRDESSADDADDFRDAQIGGYYSSRKSGKRLFWGVFGLVAAGAVGGALFVARLGGQAPVRAETAVQSNVPDANGPPVNPASDSKLETPSASTLPTGSLTDPAPSSGKGAPQKPASQPKTSPLNPKGGFELPPFLSGANGAAPELTAPSTGSSGATSSPHDASSTSAGGAAPIAASPDAAVPPSAAPPPVVSPEPGVPPAAPEGAAPAPPAPEVPAPPVSTPAPTPATPPSAPPGPSPPTETPAAPETPPKAPSENPDDPYAP